MLNKRRRLALFVGAGISFGCGLPTWAELVELLSTRAYPSATPEAQMALARQATIPRTRLLKSKLKKNFRKAVAECLYSRPYQLSNAIQRIAASGIERICSYNFDELLEEALQVADVEFKSLTPGEALNGNYKGTVVFHPHGLLPAAMGQDEPQSGTLVLSEEDYHELYSNPYSWANLVQLSLLINHTCLFVGVSVTDPNLRRLLDVCASLRFTHRHYAIMRSPLSDVDHSEKSLAKQLKSVLEGDLVSLRVDPIWVGQYNDVGKIFKAIRVNRSSKTVSPQSSNEPGWRNHR